MMKVAVLHGTHERIVVLPCKRDQTHMLADQAYWIENAGEHCTIMGDEYVDSCANLEPPPRMHLKVGEVLMKRALLCDIDGTLVQSNWLHAEAWKVAFQAMGLKLDLEELRRQIGKGGDELIPVFVPWWKRPAVEEPLKTYRKFVFQNGLRQQVKAIPGVRALLLRVREAGIKVALATSSDEDDLKVLLGLLNVEDLIEEQTTADDAARAKPHPDIFAAAVEKLGLKAKECIALGDTPYDAESAGKAGIRTIGVMTGGWSRKELYEAGCVEVYQDVEDLTRHIEQSALLKSGLRG